MKKYVVGKGTTAGTISALYGFYGDLVLCYKGEEDKNPGCYKMCEVEILTEEDIVWGTGAEIRERFCEQVEEFLVENGMVYYDEKIDAYWREGVNF